MNTNTVLIALMLGVLGYAILTNVRPPVRFTYVTDATPAVICAGESITWETGVEMTASRQPADMTAAVDLWDETHNRLVPGRYKTQPFIIPHTAAYTSTEVFSDTAKLPPAEYRRSVTLGGRLTARDAYAVRFTVRPC